MKIEDQVVSLNLAKRLKELNVKQDSLFYYERYFAPGWQPLERYDLEFGKTDFEEKPPLEMMDHTWSAFTSAELSELLPMTHVSIEYTAGQWDVNYTHEGISETFYDDNEANARTKLLIYLIENNLLKL